MEKQIESIKELKAIADSDDGVTWFGAGVKRFKEVDAVLAGGSRRQPVKARGN